MTSRVDFRSERSVFQSESEVAGTTGISFCAVNRHSLEAIVRLSERFDIRATRDVVDAQGVTLWRCGTRVSHAWRERLLGRRLRTPLEASLGVDAGMSISLIVEDSRALITEIPILAALTRAAGNALDDALNALQTVNIPAPLGLLLTTLRTLRPRDYRASLATLIVATVLTHRAGLSAHESEHIVLAALLADIGEMFIDPDILDRNRKLGPSEWKSVTRHPVLGAEFLKAFTPFPASVTDGVLRHHERFNGRGYPFQVSGEHLGLRHTVLGAADTVAAIAMRSATNRVNRVLVAIHILPGEFPIPVAKFVTKMFTGLDGLSCGGGSGDEDGAQRASFAAQLERLRAAKREATRLVHGHGRTVANTADQALNVLLCIEQSLGATRVYELLQHGKLEDNPAIMDMIGAIPDEISWRLSSLARTVYLEAAQSSGARDLSVLGKLIALLDPVSAPTQEAPVSA